MKINTGDWIGTAFEKDKIIGYVIQNNPLSKTCSIKITKSETHGRLRCLALEYNKICAHTYAGISPDDIGSLIDIALQTRDKNWFDELLHEYSLWHPVGEILKH